MTSRQSAKDEIKAAADIVELIGQYVHLKKAGRNHVGLCPFHGEKDPSFTVNQERQTFHCFGCKKGGDIFSFWMEYHSTTFPEAVRDLAERYGIVVADDAFSDEERRKARAREDLFKANELATVFFEQAFAHPTKGKPGRDYFTARGVPDRVVSELRLGYAPDEWEGCAGFLARNGVSMDTAREAGLVVPRERGGHYDRFRGRIVFPLLNVKKQVVGFGGRVLDDSLPKYLNTPETPVFHKSRFLYGLQASSAAIRRTGRAVIVEGYMDWVALRSHGIEEAVATLGTALTEWHVRKLKGFASEAVVLFDSDEAGRAAALKSLPVFLNEGFSAGAVVLPEGHDPDSYVRAHGGDSLNARLAEGLPMFDFFLEQKLGQDRGDLEGKVRVVKEILPVLSALKSDVRCSLYVKRLAERIGIEERTVWSELGTSRGPVPAPERREAVRERATPSKVGRKFDDLHLLNLLLHFPRTVKPLMDCEAMVLLSDDAVVEIVEALFAQVCRDGRCSIDELPLGLTSEAARLQLRESLFEACRFSEHEVDLALAEIEAKVQEKKMVRSFRSARGDVEALNRLLTLKRSRDRGTVPS